MIRFSQRQMTVLDAASLEAFVTRAVAHLRGRCARAAELGEAALRAAIRDGVDRAETYGVDDEADVLRFLELEFRHGPRFDERCAWARDELRRPHREGGRKLDRLEAYELFALSLTPAAD